MSVKDSEKYELLDSGDFKKLEQLGPYRVVRPSPQAVWAPRLGQDDWDNIDAIYHRFSGGDGKWETRKRRLPQQWQMHCGGLNFIVRPTDFGHLGGFFEQAANWEKIRRLSSQDHEVLNLFAYTGGSTLAAAQSGAKVVHVDASKTSVAWARELAELNALGEAPIRWIVDDVMKFVQREIRRSRKYQAIILDPPSFGRGTKGEVWKIEEHLVELMSSLKLLLSDDFSYILLSSHSHGYTPLAMENLLLDITHGVKGELESKEMVVREVNTNRALPAGAYSLFTRFGND